MNIFSFIKSRLSILDVVGEYTHLKKAGLYWKATCPFHNEKDASFTVSPHKEIYYCFGCHAGGDVISFIEKIEGCTPLDAAKFLIDRYNIEIPENIEWAKGQSTNTEAKEHYFTMCEVVTQWLHQELRKSLEALSYLTKRGVNKRSMDEYAIGYFPGGERGINGLLKVAKRRNIMPHDLIEAHIIVEGKGKSLYSPFEERIIFPIRDHLGRYCGFGGRVFKPHDERARYYNSRENPHFQKGKVIFGLDLAKPAIQKNAHLFLVEGYTDCIAMRQYGFLNTISTLGTACTVDHLTILARYCDSIGILYDGDTAGQQAIMRLAGLCWQVNLELKVISLPSSEDPASFLEMGGNLNKYIAESKDIFQFFLESISQGFQEKSLAEKMGSLRRILGLFVHIDDRLKRAVLLQQAATTFNIPLEKLEYEIAIIERKVNGQLLPGEKREVSLPVKGESSLGISRLEKKIFFAIMSNMQIFNSAEQVFLVRCFSEPLRSILECLQKVKDKDPSIDFELFFDQLNKDEQRLVSGVMLECDQEIEAKGFEYLINQFRRKHWKQLVRVIKAQLDSGQGIADSKEQLLRDFLILKEKIFSDKFNKWGIDGKKENCKKG